MWRLPLIAIPILLALLTKSKTDENGASTVLFVLSGANLAICTQVWMAERGVLISDWLIKAFWISSVIGLLVAGARSRCWSGRNMAETAAATAILVISPFLAWIQPMWRHRSVIFGAPFSNSNNDLAIYIVSADNFLHAGFREFGRIVGYQAGALSNFEVAGSSSATALVSKLTGAPIWRVATLTMLLILLATATAVFQLGRLLSIRPVIAALAAALGIIGPWSVQVQQNFFFSQAISRMALVIGLVSILQIFLENKRSSILSGVLGLGSSIWLSLVTYPSGSIVSGALLLGLVPVVWIALRRHGQTYNSRLLWQRCLIVLAVGVAVIPLVERRWSLISSNVSLYSRANVTGWPSSTESIWRLLLVPVQGFGGVLMMSFGFSVLIIYGARVVKRRESSIGSLVSLGLLLGISLVYALIVARVGISAYQTWKTLATLQVLIPVSIAGVFFHRSNEFNGQVVRKIVLGLMPVLLVWNSYRAGDTYRYATQLPTMELEQISERTEIQQDGLLIGLQPYLETMIAPVVLNLHGAVYASDTYLGPGSVDPARCAIVRGRAQPGSVQLSRSLQLRPSVACLSQ